MENNTLMITILCIISSFFFSPSSAGDTGGDGKLSFSVDYIHRDSPLSPFHNSSQTQYESFRASVNRDRLRLSLKLNNDDDIVSEVHLDSLQYLMKISIGTPPFKILALVDTGSDLIWTQCKPCLNCYKLDSPIFDPSVSKTYRQISCDPSECFRDGPFRCDKNRKCSYFYSYGDGTAVTGIVATDTMTFDSSSDGKQISLGNIKFGCTHRSSASFHSKGAGLVGLSPGRYSLITQLGSRIDFKFSYCLLPLYASKFYSSTFYFGTSPKPITETVIVPIVELEDFYVLDLESIKIGDEIVPMNGNGKIMVDSGTTLTYLMEPVYSVLKSVVSKHVDRILGSGVDEDNQFDMCWFARELDIGELLPRFELDFGDDTVLTLPASNVFVSISPLLVCLAVAKSTHPGLSILGGVAQQNFQVEYDIGFEAISFARTDCTNY